MNDDTPVSSSSSHNNQHRRIKKTTAPAGSLKMPEIVQNVLEDAMQESVDRFLQDGKKQMQEEETAVKLLDDNDLLGKFSNFFTYRAATAGTHRDFSVLRKALRNGVYAKEILSEQHSFVMCVEGPDGAGKSTLVKKLTNLVIPSAPQVILGMDATIPKEPARLVCNTYQHPNNNPKISPTGCTVRKWLSSGNALGASTKDEMSAPLFQAAMMESWAELQSYISKVTALRILVEGNPVNVANREPYNAHISASSVTTPLTIIDRSPISCIVYGTLSAIPAMRMRRFMENGALPSCATLILAPSVETVRRRILEREGGDASLARMEEDKPGYLDAVCSAYRYLHDKQIGYLSDLRQAESLGLISGEERHWLNTHATTPAYLDTDYYCANAGNKAISLLYNIPAMYSAITGDAPIDTTALQTLMLADMHMTLAYLVTHNLKYRKTKLEITAQKVEQQKSIDILTVPYSTLLGWMQEWAISWPGRYSDRSYTWFEEVINSIHML